jgi:ACT domain-containing protein
MPPGSVRPLTDPTSPAGGQHPARFVGGGVVASEGDAVDRRSYTIRLELEDQPGELLAALEPIAEHGGNLLGVVHERGSLTPTGHVPVEVDLECPAGRFSDLVTALRASGVAVVRAGEERYTDSVSVVLIGHLVDTGLSDTLERIQEKASVDVTDVALSAPEGTEGVSSARVTMATTAGDRATALEAVRSVASAKELRVLEPVRGE